jgi:hypothetical protein
MLPACRLRRNNGEMKNLSVLCSSVLKRKPRSLIRSMERFGTTWNKLEVHQSVRLDHPRATWRMLGATFFCLRAPLWGPRPCARRNIVKRYDTFSQCTQIADTADETPRHDVEHFASTPPAPCSMVPPSYCHHSLTSSAPQGAAECNRLQLAANEFAGG